MKARVVPLSRDIRELKRTVANLVKAVARLHATAAQHVERPLPAKVAEVSDDEIKSARITGKVVKNLRKKLGISQEKLAALLDVSPGAVAFCEQGRARPRSDNKAAIIALRTLGRRDVKRMLKDKGIVEERGRRARV